MRRASKPVKLAVALAAVAMAVGLASALVSPREGYAPSQPILFQHKRMAGPPNWVQGADGQETNLGGFSIPCLYCHTMAYEGRHATLPSTDVCMNCHSTVGQDKEWVIALKAYDDDDRPIPWVKVHDLPDFAYFDHSAHLTALDDQGKQKVDCADCHGAVEETDVVRVENRLNMGWCLDCHRKPEMQAATDCVTCHR